MKILWRYYLFVCLFLNFLFVSSERLQNHPLPVWNFLQGFSLKSCLHCPKFFSPLGPPCASTGTITEVVVAATRANAVRTARIANVVFVFICTLFICHPTSKKLYVKINKFFLVFAILYVFSVKWLFY